MRRKTRLLLLLTLAGLLLPVAVPPGTRAQSGELRTKFRMRFLNQKAPDFTLEDLAGSPVRLADFRGSPVLLNFWYSACLPCRRETPDLATLYRLHHKKGLVILGINLDEIITPSSEGLALQEFVKNIEIPYPILKGDMKVFEAYGSVPAQPTSFIIDAEGTIVEIFWGARPGKVFDKAVRPYLDGRGAAQR